MIEYWEWWIGAPALGGFVALFAFLTGRPLGVSGSWRSITEIGYQREQDKLRRQFEDNKDAASSALMAETLAEFGEDMDDLDTPSMGAVLTAEDTPHTIPPAPWTAHLVFLLMMLVGSALSMFLAEGSIDFQLQVNSLYQQIFTGANETWAFMAFGGLLVGFGTQMAGGCTSGHGLSGCSQLIPASFLATAVFFGSGMVMSFLLEEFAK